MSATELTTEDIGPLPRLGGIYASSLPMLGKSIALPAGRWRVIAEQKSAFAGYPPGATVTVIRTAHGVFTGGLQISGNAVNRPASGGWPLNPVCEFGLRPDDPQMLLGRDLLAAEAGETQDCLALTTQRGTDWQKDVAGKSLAAMARSLRSLHVSIPSTALLIAIGEADGQYRLVEQIWLNPALSGLAAADWTRNGMVADLTLRRYVARVLQWAKEWRGVVRRALTDSAAMAPKDVAEIQ